MMRKIGSLLGTIFLTFSLIVSFILFLYENSPFLDILTLYDIDSWSLYYLLVNLNSLLLIILSLAIILYIVNNNKNKSNYFFFLLIGIFSFIFTFFNNNIEYFEYFSAVNIVLLLSLVVTFSVLLIMIFLERKSIKKLYFGLSLAGLAGIIISGLTELLLVLLGSAFFDLVFEVLEFRYIIIYNIPSNIRVISNLILLTFFGLSLFDESVDNIDTQELSSKNMQKSIRCPKCSTFIDSDAKYCYSCGSKVSKATTKKRTVIKKIT
jgi:hypothetical protein